MAIRTVTQIAPFVIPAPGDPPQGFPDDKASLHMGHTGEGYTFYWVYREDSPRVINPATGDVRRWIMNFTSQTHHNSEHQKIRLVFEDSLESDEGAPAIREWDWAEWVPYFPDHPANGNLQSLPANTTFDPS